MSKSDKALDIVRAAVGRIRARLRMSNRDPRGFIADADVRNRDEQAQTDIAEFIENKAAVLVLLRAHIAENPSATDLDELRVVGDDLVELARALRGRDPRVCTCTVTPHERQENRKCPVHAIADFVQRAIADHGKLHKCPNCPVMHTGDFDHCQECRRLFSLSDTE